MSLLEMCWEKGHLLLFELDEGGIIQRTSSHVDTVLGPNLAGRNFAELLVDFQSSWSLGELCAAGSDGQLLNLTTPEGLPQSFTLYCRRDNGRHLIVGERDSRDVELLQSQLVNLNNQMADLTRELQKKNAELEKLNDVKNHFLGMAAHDLRNPLSVIMGYSEFMLQEKHAFSIPEFISLLNDIRYLSDFMLSMINDLLDISSIEAGKLDLSPQPVDISGLISKTVELNQVFADKKKVSLKLVSSVADMTCLADLPRVKQVLNNLISNALKYSPKGEEVRITVDPAEAALRIGVHDQGPGVPSDEQDGLFAPFTRLSVKPEDGEKGAGLGLSICQKIIKAHQGRIWYEPGTDGGSSFYFTLPLDIEDAS